jgi:hypothetical protein
LLDQFIYKPLHVRNVIVWPMLDGQSLECLDGEGQGFEDDIGFTECLVVSLATHRHLLTVMSGLISHQSARQSTLAGAARPQRTPVQERGTGLV